MNAQAVLVEARYARPIMSSFHGVYSLGGLLGAATAGVIAGQGIAPERHLLAIGALLLGLVLIARSHLIPASGEGQSDGPAFALATGPLAGIGAIAFCVLVAEGAMADWSAVFLREVVGAGPAVAAMGYTAFSLTMAAVRFAGDSLTERLGPVRVIRSGGVLVAVGLTLALLTAAPVLTLIGFGLVGVGLAAAFPITLSAAGRTPRVPTGTAIAAVATAGYAGFLVGPPVIGFVSHASSLRFGLACVLLLGIAIALLAGQVARAAGPGAVAHVAAADAGADV
jgi:MFS family permease